MSVNGEKRHRRSRRSRRNTRLIILIVWVPILISAMATVVMLLWPARKAVEARVPRSLAERTGTNPDTYLMAIAVGASCAFLTPIGHQNNTIVMGPGGYRFGDYWRMGLPLEIIVVVVAMPLLLVVWPL